MNRLIFVFWLLVSAGSAQGAEFFVAPDGKPDGTGQRSSPWDLLTALAHPAAVKPGDTIWLAGGAYQGSFTSRLRGQADAPITVRQAPGERATIDCKSQNKRPASFTIEGEWVRFQDFEVTCTDERRDTRLTGSWPADLDRGGIFCRASHASFINLVVHDTGTGFGFWADGEGGEIYGCLIYYNGWRAPDRGHGHAIYTQNVRGTKRLAENIIFSQFGDGIHAYGSDKAIVEGYEIEGNVLFNNGSLTRPGERTVNILAGGSGRTGRIAITNNFTYHTGLEGTSVQLGYGSSSDDIIVRNNYFAGYVRVLPWKRLEARGNTFVGLTSLLEVRVPSRDALANYSWDHNIYLSGEVKYTPFLLLAGQERLSGNWKVWNQSGLDASSTYTVGKPTGTSVFVRPNRYEPGRGHVIVYNWDRAPKVSVDLKPILKPGQAFRIVSADNFYREPILRGRYEAKPIEVPMEARKPAAPVGMKADDVPLTGPEFAALIVLPE